MAVYIMMLSILPSLLPPLAKANATDWMAFWISPNAIDDTGLTTKVVKAKLDIHCVRECLADITCTGMNYGKFMVNPECQLFHGTLVSDFDMISDPERIAILPFPRTCSGLKSKYGEKTKNGVFDFFDTEKVSGVIRRRSFKAYCDQSTDGGGWTVIQRRSDGSVDFYRGWDDYKAGFGNPDGEYWIGLNLIHILTSAQPTELRVDLEDFDGNKAFAVYSTFKVSNEIPALYELTISGYQSYSTAGDSMTYHNGQSFSTKDNNNINCSVKYHGAWWYSDSSGGCHRSNLNGEYKGGPHETFADGVNWRYWLGHRYSLKISEMKVRPINV